MSAYRDYSGEQFGRLTVLERVACSKAAARLLVRCECGTVKQVWYEGLRSGSVRSCGCLRLEIITTHGLSNTPEYHAWTAMHQRCSNPDNDRYDDYGGRGITVCKRWSEFQNFVEDMGPRPSADHSLDRKKNNKGYYPTNCHWATDKEQANNRRLPQ